MLIYSNKIFNKLFFDMMGSNDLLQHRDLLNFINLGIISEKLPQDLSFREYSLIRKQLKEEYLSFLMNIDLSDYIDNMKDLESFLSYHVSIEYLESSVCELSILNLIDKHIVDSYDEKLKLLDIDSLTEFMGLSYPSYTCPMIDSEKDNIKTRISELEDDNEEKQSQIKELEEEEEAPDCYTNSDISDIQDLICDNDIEIAELYEDELLAEELRTSCKKVREVITNSTSDYKSELTVYLINDIVLFDIPEFDKDFAVSNMDDVYEEPSFNKADFSDAIKNLEEIYEMGIEVFDGLDDGLKSDIERSSVYDRSEYVQELLSDLKSKYNK